jgi:hypothetical protein
MFEVLEGIKRRCEELGMELPSMLVADNCCQIEKEAHKAMPDIQICLDVYHFMMRYILIYSRANSDIIRSRYLAAIRRTIERTRNDLAPPYWIRQRNKTSELDQRLSLSCGILIFC